MKKKITLLLLIVLVICLVVLVGNSQTNDQSNVQNIAESKVQESSKPSASSSSLTSAEKKPEPEKAEAPAEQAPEKPAPSTTKQESAPNTGGEEKRTAAPTEPAESAQAPVQEAAPTQTPAAPGTLEWFNQQTASALAQLILNANAEANGGQPNMVIDTDAKAIALATKACDYNNARGSIAHNYIPAPGGQNVAGGKYQVTAYTAENAQRLAQKLFKGYYDEKQGYDYLLQAGYTPEQIVSGQAQVTVDGVTYSEKGMAGTGFQTKASGGVVSHYAEIANQVPSKRATKFSVSVVYDPAKGFVSTAADFFRGDAQYVYQLMADGSMGYVKY